MKQLNRHKPLQIGCIAALFLCAMAVQARIERIDFHDRHGNKLFYISYDYDGGDNLVSRSLYDVEGFFLRKITTSTDDAGRANRINFLNFDDQPLSYTNYHYDGLTTALNIYDNYTINRLTPFQATYSKTANGVYDFQAGSQSHRLQYHYSAAGKVQKIDILNASNTMTHYAMVIGKDHTVPTSVPSIKPAHINHIHLVAGNIINLRFTATGNQQISAMLYDVRGRSAQTLIQREFSKGTHTLQLKTDRLEKAMSTGVYLLRVALDDAVMTKTLQLVR